MPANLNTYSISAITNAVQPLLNEQKIAQKNAQPVQKAIHQNAAPEKEQQNPEVKNIPKA